LQLTFPIKSKELFGALDGEWGEDVAESVVEGLFLFFRDGLGHDENTDELEIAGFA
jgi:hypothetical protein